MGTLFCTNLGFQSVGHGQHSLGPSLEWYGMAGASPTPVAGDTTIDRFCTSFSSTLLILTIIRIRVVRSSSDRDVRGGRTRTGGTKNRSSITDLMLLYSGSNPRMYISSVETIDRSVYRCRGVITGTSEPGRSDHTGRGMILLYIIHETGCSNAHHGHIDVQCTLLYVFWMAWNLDADEKFLLDNR